MRSPVNTHRISDHNRDQTDEGGGGEAWLEGGTGGVGPQRLVWNGEYWRYEHLSKPVLMLKGGWTSLLNER